MGRTELPWLLWGRHVAPLGLAASFACAVEAFYVLVVGNTAGQSLDHRSAGGLVVGVTALLASVLLNAGWWAKSNGWTRTGLWLAAGVFTVRTVILWLGTPTPGTTDQSVYYSAAWVAAIGGAFLLEVHDSDGTVEEIRRAWWRGAR